ncbi:STAS domain-containing protein [Streptomyces sp. NBC_00207]|uniref:STAS domain-containing protein n=1 Tax=unclassified Streptomyces TaxID=2593676 RepID=UPI0028841ECD|nr:STAS domain-containing protein [Streptomyces sp. DSM 41633]
MTATASDRRLCSPKATGLKVGVMPGPQTGQVQVVVSGEIDLDNVAFLHEVLLTALVSPRAALLVDLEQVTFCDCAGLNTLLAARHAALTDGRDLHITAAGPRVEQLLNLTATRSLLM